MNIMDWMNFDRRLLKYSLSLRLLTARFRSCSRLVGLNMSPEAVLVCNVANLPKHAMLVLVSIAAFHLMWVMALLLFPLFVTFVIDHFVTVLVWVKLMVFVILMMLYECKNKQSTLFKS